MPKQQMEFDDWFELVQSIVIEETGIEFRDKASVRREYERGDRPEDIASEIVAEYND